MELSNNFNEKCVKPKVSVIIPCYNVEEYLSKCLDSVVNQTLKDIEIICIDDGATDYSGKILDEYASKDNRIKVIHKENGGYGKAMNIGLAKATGEYIGIVEPDDYIDINMFKTLYELSDKDTDIVKSNFYRMSDYRIAKINKFNLNYTKTSNINIPDFITNGHPCIWSAIYNRKFLKKHNINFNETPGAAFQDVGFNIKSWLFAQNITVTKDAYYYYRTDNEESSVNKGHKMAFVTLNEYKLLYKYLEQYDIDKNLYSIINIKTFRGLMFNFDRRITKNRFRFLNECHKIFAGQLRQNHIDFGYFNKGEKRIFDRITKNHFLYYISTLFLLKRYLTADEKQTYICRIPLYKTTKTLTHKVYRIGGIKISKSLKKKSLKTDNDIKNEFLFNLYQNYQFNKNKDKVLKYPTDILNLLSQIKNTPDYLYVDGKHNYLNLLLNKPEFCYSENFDVLDEIYLCWECRPINYNIKCLNKALMVNKPLLYVGDSFLRSINTFADKDALLKYKKGISFTIDDLGSYFDATRPNRLEMMLNDKNLVISLEQKERARKCIEKIVKNHLTKYNHQPIYTPQIGRNNVQKVLVVDQSYGDMSITKGLANDETFKQMLQDAIQENPDADIIVKTHPDTIAGCGGYYKGLKEYGNIYTQTEPINPISLINYVDKVYVVTTQFGFEALMCGKEVHVYGMPFYAGWGLTVDKQTCTRRNNTRTLEEIFYITYILYSFYVNPEKQNYCEIEEAMDYLLKLREEYFEIQSHNV